MTENGSAPAGSQELPDVVVHHGRGMSIVWLVPVIALLVGIYLAWDAYQNRGVSIVIHYATAEWVEAGKTKLKHLAVDIGTVDEVKLAANGGVDLHCTMVKEATPHLTEGSQFWIVHPRIGGGQVSGLGTLLSGAYIGVELGEKGGKRARRFEGLDEPPVASSDDGGLRIELHADELRSVNIGTGVFYRGTKVAAVERFELNKDADGVIVHVYLPEKFAPLVRKNSRFWDLGGFEISAGMGKVDLHTGSLSAMLAGGIGFDAPTGEKSPAAANNASYWLHTTHDDIATNALRYGGLHVVVEAEHLGGAAVNDPVSYREMVVGAVISQELTSDSRRLRLHLNIQDRYRNLIRTNTVFWNASGISADLGLSGLHVHAESLQALLSGGVAFATPDPPGHLAKAGSVFKLRPEFKDKWLQWDPVLQRGPAPAKAKNEAAAGAADAKTGDDEPGLLERFFHHKGKSEEDAAKDAEPRTDGAQEAAHHEKKHGLLSRRHR